MYDMIRENYMSGAQILQVCKSQLINETASDVLTTVARRIIPSVIKRYIPLEHYEQCHKDIFDLFHGILSKNKIQDKATQNLFLDTVLSSARSDDNIEKIRSWFDSGYVHDTAGNKMESLEVPLKQKHTIVQRIWSSTKISLDVK